MSDDIIQISDRADGVRVLTITNPPVNAVSAAVRQGLKDAVEAAGADPSVRAVVVTGAGKTFVAGADIREFGKEPPPGNPTLPEVIHALEDCPKTVVAAINGPAAGGGLEIALGCHWRVAVPKAVVGLPEVNLGIIPGATGTQRLPRAAGVEAALDLVVSARLVSAKRAQDLGVVDALAEDDIVGAAAAMALDRAPRKLREQDERLREADPALFDEYRKGMARKYRGFIAPFEAVDIVKLATELPYDEAIRKEREVFVRLRDGEQAKALRHVFFAEREVSRVPGIPKGTEARAVERAAVVGCGTMGGGIAMVFANAGIPVTVLETARDALDRGLATIAKNYAATVARGGLSQAEMDRRIALISGTVDHDDLADADIVVEAAFEDMDVKKAIFGRLDDIVRPDAILATNTSTLDVDEIAAATRHPERVVGTHFFSPANVMKLLENVRGAKTAPDVAQTVMKLASRLGKVGVMVGLCDGFVGNRMLLAYTRQAEFLLEEGALPEQVDRVIHDFGFPMGPFAMYDLAGNDVVHLIRQAKIKRDGPSGKRESALVDILYGKGRYGQKAGLGWYRYDGRTPSPDPEVEALVVAASAEAGIARREISDTEILERCLYPLVNEGAKILAEGVAARPLDVDLVWIHGYGFPRYRGGPMFWADQIGLGTILERLIHYRDSFDADWLEPAPLLVELAGAGRGFAEWAAAREA